MKKFLKGLTALLICGALNFGLTLDAQATEINGTESQKLASHHRYDPPPRGDHWGRRPPPPRHGDYWGDYPPPPRHGDDYWNHDYPPPRPGHRPPPPPQHRW